MLLKRAWSVQWCHGIIVPIVVAHANDIGSLAVSNNLRMRAIKSSLFTYGGAGIKLEIYSCKRAKHNNNNNNN